jgi:hypothetical protein
MFMEPMPVPTPAASTSQFLMPLTQDQQQAVANHLNTRGQAPKCPVCGASNLRVRPELSQLPIDGRNGRSQTAINVECNYCGYILHFSTRVIDIDVGSSGSNDTGP